MFQHKRISLAVWQALSLGVAASVAGSALAQTATTEKTVVTGSNIKRIETESALPVTVITKEEILRSGTTTAAELLDKVSANGSYGNYNTTLALGDAARPGYAAASLRGLGANKTLVLLNGRRITNYALDTGGGAVDLNSIPLAAIERVEILKDGASAVYGTDAIGGVINFITKNDYTGGEVTAYYGDTHLGGGQLKKGTATIGFGNLSQDRFNAFLNFDWQKEDPIKASQRSYAASAYIPGEGVNRLSSNAFPANVLLPSGALVSPNAPGCLPPTSFAVPAGSTRCRFDYASVIDIVNPSEHTNFMGRATFKIDANNSLFAEGAYSEGKYKFAISPSPISAQTTFSGEPLLLPVSSPYYPTAFAAANGVAGQPLSLFYRSVDGGPRTDETKSQASRALFGAKGTIGAWDYETAVMRSESKVTDSYTSGWFKESVFLPNFATGLINPFGPNNAQGLALLQAAEINQQIRSGKGTTTTVDGKVSSELFNLPAGPLGFAAGFEYRKEQLDQIADPILNSGDILGSGGNIQSQSGSRTVKALFAEVRVPVVKTLDLSGAVRYDKYSDFGSTTNPKVTLEWRPLSTLILVRGSAGTGFRAPGLPELYTPQSQSNTGGVYDDPLRCPTTHNQAIDCGLQFNTLQGGNPQLKPEKSDQYTFGFVLQPTDQMSVSVDYFSIKLKDQIGFIGDTTIFANFAQYASSNIVRGPVDPNFPNLPGPIRYVLTPYTNLGEVKTAGIDVDLKSKYNVGFGTLGVNWVGTYVTKYDVLNTDGSFSSIVGQSAPPQGAVARWRHNLGFTLDSGPWSGTVAQNYQLGYEDQNLNASGVPRRVGSYETYDAQLSHTGLIKGLTVRAGVRNIFDRAPPFSNQNSTFQVGYDPSYGDPRGRFMYGAVTYAFK